MSDWTTYLYAFLIGGGFCVIAQILIDKTELTPARILVVYVSAGVLLGIFKGGFTAAAAGCSAALVFGYLAALVFKGKRKG